MAPDVTYRLQVLDMGTAAIRRHDLVDVLLLQISAFAKWVRAFQHVYVHCWLYMLMLYVNVKKLYLQKSHCSLQRRCRCYFIMVRRHITAAAKHETLMCLLVTAICDLHNNKNKKQKKSFEIAEEQM